MTAIDLNDIETLDFFEFREVTSFKSIFKCLWFDELIDLDLDECSQ